MPQSKGNALAARFPKQAPAQSERIVKKKEKRQKRRRGGGQKPAPIPAAPPSSERAAARKTASFGESVWERSMSAAV